MSALEKDDLKNLKKLIEELEIAALFQDQRTGPM